MKPKEKNGDEKSHVKLHHAVFDHPSQTRLLWKVLQARLKGKLETPGRQRKTKKKVSWPRTYKYY